MIQADVVTPRAPTINESSTEKIMWRCAGSYIEMEDSIFYNKPKLLFIHPYTTSNPIAT